MNYGTVSMPIFTDCRRFCAVSGSKRFIAVIHIAGGAVFTRWSLLSQLEPVEIIMSPAALITRLQPLMPGKNQRKLL